MAEIRLPAPVKAILSVDLDQDQRAGAYEFYHTQDTGPDVVRGMVYRCPCGCGTLHGLAFPPLTEDDKKYGRAQWTWDGNRESPTLSPSILSHEGGTKDGPTHWHGFLRKGHWEQA